MRLNFLLNSRKAAVEDVLERKNPHQLPCVGTRRLSSGPPVNLMEQPSHDQNFRERVEAHYPEARETAAAGGEIC